MTSSETGFPCALSDEEELLRLADVEDPVVSAPFASSCRRKSPDGSRGAKNESVASGSRQWALVVDARIFGHEHHDREVLCSARWVHGVRAVMTLGSAARSSSQPM